MTNVIPFPRCTESRPLPRSDVIAAYEFTTAELAKLCRWYSAMKYAFPQIQGVMTVSHKEKVSPGGLYGRDGTTPNCLISKHEAHARVYLLWAHEPDPTRLITSMSEITYAHVMAIE